MKSTFDMNSMSTERLRARAARLVPGSMKVVSGAHAFIGFFVTQLMLVVFHVWDTHLRNSRGKLKDVFA